MALRLKLKVDVLNDAMIVWLPGTLFAATFKKPNGFATTAKSVWAGDDRDGPITSEGFRAMALTAAQEKAREMGWIS